MSVAVREAPDQAALYKAIWALPVEEQQEVVEALLYLQALDRNEAKKETK